MPCVRAAYLVDPYFSVLKYTQNPNTDKIPHTKPQDTDDLYTQTDLKCEQIVRLDLEVLINPTHRSIA